MDYNGGAGVQHIALKTQDIITAVRSSFLVLIHLSSSSRANLCKMRGGGVVVAILGPLRQRRWLTRLSYWFLPLQCRHIPTPESSPSLQRVALLALKLAGAKVRGSLDSSPSSASDLLCVPGGFKPLPGLQLPHLENEDIRLQD